MSACAQCGHTRSAHHQITGNTYECVLCGCTQELSVAVSVREAARRYAAERGCNRMVNNLTEEEIELLAQVLREAGQKPGLVPMERTDRDVLLRRITDKLGLDNYAVPGLD